MLRGLRRTHPDAQITVVTHDLFGHVPVPASLFDRWIPFPAHDVGGELARSPVDWSRQVQRLRAFADDIASEPFDLTLNLTHSDLSGLLAAALPSRGVRGGLVAQDRTRVVQGPWMTYFWSSQTCRELGCFNLVDIHNWTAGVTADRSSLEIAVPDAARERMRAWIDGRGLAQRPLIAVQLGASDDRKRWTPERFADALAHLPVELGEVVLVGSPAERELATRFQGRSTRPVHDAVGATSIPELAALLARCRVLVTNDTGTMHVATAVGTRVVDVSTGPVFVHETGPYGDGHFVIEPAIECFPCAAGSVCSHVSCHDFLDPRDVAALVAHALDAGPLPRPERARVLRGRFEVNGRVAYDTVWPRPTRVDTLRDTLARVWESTLPVTDVVSGEMAAPVTQSEERADVTAISEVALGCDAASDLARRIGRATSDEHVRLSGQIGAFLDGLQRRAHLVPEIKPIAAYLKVRLDSITARDLRVVAGVYEEELAQAARRARLLAAGLAAPVDVMRRSA